MLRLYFEELKSAQVDRDAMKEQAEGLRREYDRVCSLLKQAEVSFSISLNING